MTAARLGFVPDWPAPANVRGWVTERGGAGSRFATLNFAAHVGDQPATVLANRERLRAELKLPVEPTWLEQVHGTRVLDLDAEGLAAADGAVTARPGVVCAVLTADCLPVLLCDRAGRRVGAVHAGWRGLLNGILPVAVAALGGDPAQLMAWLGPAISPAAFEVGADVREPFVARDSSAAAHFVPNARGRWQADLFGLARASLGRAGVRAVYGGGVCTFGDERRFFSHRRAAPCGRMATLIWLEPVL